MPLTRLMDMHSGGGQKDNFAYCYIEAPESEAKLIFFNLFGHNPERVSCTCYGEDYSIDEYETLELATAFERGCEWSDEKKKYLEKPSKKKFKAHDYMTLDKFKERTDVKIVSSNDITNDERKGTIPEQGYV